MLSLQFIREHPDEVRRAVASRHVTAPLDDIVRLDMRRRELQRELDELRAERNALSKRIGGTRDETARSALVAESRAVGERVTVLEREMREVEPRLAALLLEVPNIPDADVPLGPDESGNVVRQQEEATQAFDFPPRAHWDLGPELGIVDFERGARMSGSRFYVLFGVGARLQHALIRFMLDLHVREHGFVEVYPPFVVKEEALVAAAQLPKFRENLYHDAEEDVWLVPTAEVPLTNLHRDEILDGADLPLRYVAYTPCFRRERMSAGRDVRGIKRGHQFDKVEMYVFCRPEESERELERLLESAREVCRRLGLAHRVVELCTGDLGFAAARTFDIEIWAPGCGEWLEVSSCSNVRDFQGRRANVRFRAERGGRPEHVHTLNGSGLALPRTLIGILETYQQPDGSVVVPAVLRPYMGGVERIGAPAP